MRTCIVCGNTFNEMTEGACPCCRFPVLTSLDDNADALSGFAKEYQKEYLSDVRLGVMCTTWKASGSTLIPDQEECVFFADGTAPVGTDVWCGRQLARCAEGDSVTVRLVIEKGGHRRIVDTPVPNLPQPQLQQVGVRLCDGLHVCVLLRNNTKTTASRPVSLVGRPD